MNTQYCPECETELTRSIVGYLCHGCGSVYGFEKVPSMPISSSAPAKHTKSVHTKHSKFAVNQPDMHPSKQVKPSKIRHHIKKFVVPQVAEIKNLEKTPELPAPPLEEQGLPARLAEPAPHPNQPLPTMPIVPPEETYAQHHSEYNPHLTEKALSELSKDYSPPAPANSAASYILPALAGLLVVGALVIAYIVIR